MNIYSAYADRIARAIHPATWIALASIASVLTLSLWPVERGHSVSEEYLCVIIPIITLTGSIISIKEKRRIKLSLIDWLVLGWYLYSMGRLLLDSAYPASGFAMRASMILLLYASLRIIFSSVRINGKTIVLFLIFCALVESTIGYYQLLNGASRHYLYPVSGSFFNPGPYSAYIALGMVLLLALKNKNVNHLENIKLSLLVLLFTQLMLSMSRASFLAVGVCLVIVYHQRIKGLKQWGVVVGIALVLGGVFYLFKSGSADGRGIINYIGIRCIFGNPWFGNGIGSFFNCFAEETVYLSQSGNTTGLMKVDVIDYAFNDLLRVGSEQGLVGLVFASAFITIVLLRLWHKCRPLMLGGMSLLIISLFSYPFELLPYQIIAAIIAAFAGTSNASPQASANYSRLFATLKSGLFLAMMCTILVSCLKDIRAARGAECEYELIAGFDDSAFTKDYYNLLPYLHDNKYFLFDFAKMLSKQHRYNDSNDMLRRGTLISNDPMFLVLQGNNYRKMGAVGMAEEMYLKAWHVMPNRIYPLYRLMMLYEENGNSTKAMEYADKVVAFREKIPSPAVKDMKDEAQKIININTLTTNDAHE